MRQVVTCRDPNNNELILEDGYCDSSLRPGDVVPCSDLANCPGLFCNKAANHAEK